MYYQEVDGHKSLSTSFGIMGYSQPYKNLSRTGFRLSCKFLTGFLVVVEVKIWSVEIGADLVQMKSEFPEASFLQGFLRVFLVQIWLSPLKESQKCGSFFCIKSF